MSYLRLSNLSKHSIWAIGLLASPLFALPAVESRTGEPVIPANSVPSQRHSSASSRSFEPTYSSSAPLSAEDRAAHLTLTQIEALQREVSELRGLVETQEHQIKQLKKSQQDLYVDLESRIKLLQSAGHAVASSSAHKASKPVVGTGPTTVPVGGAAINPAVGTAVNSTASATVNPTTGAAHPAVGSAAQPTPRSAVNSTANTANTANKGVKPGASVSSVSASAPTSVSTPSSVSSASAPSAFVKPVSSVSATPTSGEEQEAYQAAYQLVRTKRYGEAISSLQQYLNRFPKASNAAAAHYWLGEVYLLQWQNDKANDTLLEKAFHEFSTVTTAFPQHAKVMDATLKLGLIEFDKGNQATAEHYLTEVKTRYPGTAAARLAETRLQQISSD